MLTHSDVNAKNDIKMMATMKHYCMGPFYFMPVAQKLPQFFKSNGIQNVKCHIKILQDKGQGQVHIMYLCCAQCIQKHI